MIPTVGARLREVETARLLLAAARYLGETLDPHHVYERFRELMAEAIPHDGVVVSTFDPSDGTIRCEYAWVDGDLLDPAIFPPLQLRASGGMQSEVIRTGRPLLTNDVEARVHDAGTYYDVDREGTMRKVPDEGSPKARAAMMLPVKHEGAVVGVVQLMSDHVTYEAQQLELAEGMVAQMTLAVRNARLHQTQLRLEAAAAADRAAVAERERAVQVLEAVGDGIYFVDDDGVVRFWNRAAELVTGIRRETALDRPVEELLVEWPAIVGAVQTAGADERSHSATLPIEVNGRELWLSFVAVRTAGGIVYAFRDLTSERRLEESKTEFIATVSHELRTPMTAVLGAANTLLRTDVELTEDTRRRLLEMISAQAARLGQVTDRVLLAGRLDRDEVTVDRSVVDVERVVREAVSALEPTVPDSTTIEQRLRPDVTAAGDPDRLQQVLLNLVDNAVKYAGSGAKVVVSTRSDGERVQIEVADDGPGIAAGERERIFEKFYRGDPSLRFAPGGTGLGLYICRELVERMGGRITVASEPSSGSTFSVELAAIPAREEAVLATDESRAGRES
jgi:two-component system phosphate regulon sensor histidine kinase PhoR